ncbi:MAG: dimethyl sulfoxide reductase anchor subunit family protein [Endozoicomonas sp.]
MSQLSLVIFTVLAQSAVGIFIALGLVSLIWKTDDKTMTRSFMVSLVLLGIGALASITHLSQPLRMFNVLMGIQHGSALSLEIVALSLFGGSAAAYVGMRLFDLLPAVRQLVLIVAMILGVVFLLAIANVYTLETVPTWNSSWTPFQFVMTAAVVGPLGAAALLALQGSQPGFSLKQISKALAVISCMALVVAMAGYGGYLAWLGQLGVHTNPFAVAAFSFNLPVIRASLLMVAMLLWVVAAVRDSLQCSHVPATGFLMVLVSELMGRAFFYDVYISASAGM